MKSIEAAIIRAALVCIKPGRKDVTLKGYPGIRYVYSLDDNVIYRNLGAEQGASGCRIIK